MKKRPKPGRIAFVPVFVCGVVAATLAAATALATPEEGGHVSGRLVVRGEIPPAEPIPPGKDACCQAAKPVDQSVVVGPEGGLANVIVSVEPRRGEATPPAGDAEPGEPATLTNHGCAFAPRVAITRVGQTLELANDDPTMHNVNIGFVRNRSVNVVIPPRGRRDLPMEKPERRPIEARCNVHPFMRAWVVVRDDPYAVVTDPSGRFELPALPPGEWRLRFWREGRPLAGLAVGGSTTDKRGELLLAVPPGGVELGDLEVAAEGLRDAG